MKAVVLEDYAIQQGDLDWSGVKALVPDITRYGRTAQEEVVPRIGDAEIVFLNKCRIDEAVLVQCPKLRWVGIIATGTDNLDLKACRRHGVPVANVPGYSTYSVAQMTFSLLLAICQCADRYHRLVQDGQWRTEEPAAYGLLPQVELLGKTDDKTYVIASKVGYQEQNYFSYVFKKRFGISPTKFRGAKR